jgi:transcriptional regulator with XRE-family HTH domain
VKRPAPKQPTKIDAHIGARLRRLRLAREMAQAELWRQLGVSFMQVQKYESGTNRVSATRLFQIAKLFYVSIGSFFEGL